MSDYLMTVDTESKSFLTETNRYKFMSFVMNKTLNIHYYKIKQVSKNKYQLWCGNKAKKTRREFLVVFHSNTYKPRSFGELITR
jgi:hypothetical protein